MARAPIRLAVLLAAVLLAAVGAALLTGCGDSSDGPVLSDEEKIQKAHAGREAQMGAQDGPKPADPAAGGK